MKQHNQEECLSVGGGGGGGTELEEMAHKRCGVSLWWLFKDAKSVVEFC